MPAPAGKDDKKKRRTDDVKVPKDLAEQFPPDHLQACIKYFMVKDKRDVGFIESKDLGLMLRQLGGNPTDEEIEEWKQTYQVEGSKLTLLGFLQCAALELRTHKTDADVYIAFKIFDIKETGTIKDEAIREHMTTKCESFPPEMVRDFFDEANGSRNEEGDIRYEDFIQKMTAEAQKVWNKKAKKLGLLAAPPKAKKGKKKK